MAPLIPRNGNDNFNTPEWLAYAIVDHFKPSGVICEPCSGSGNFLKFLPTGTKWYEINKGVDFLLCNEKFDWIITNPPFSLFRKFLRKSMQCADNIVFLCPINHFWLKARIRDMQEEGFWFKEIIIVDTPREFPQSGFQWGIVRIIRWKNKRAGNKRIKSVPH